ncbi:MAG: PQQ-binding-like beta-propeller repeat protein [Verrucomicrobiales bacterium]|nr:PQQ-binding-like beta-propeller repeat protein [Verrucomicrobiales bacterium]
MKLTTLAIFISLIIFNLFTSNTKAEDWPQWRGSNRDGICKEQDLLKEWPKAGPMLTWKAKGLGIGFSSIAIMQGKLYTLGDLKDGSYAIALNEKNGKIIWKTRIGKDGGHRGYPGTRSTPTVDEGQIFALNQHSDIVCLDSTSGKLIWKKNLVTDFGGKMMSGWKYSESPLVDSDKVICTPGGKEGTLLALNRKTGDKIWQTKDWTDAAAYSSIIIATIHGTRQYIQLTGNSVAGVEPETGKILWRANRKGQTAVITTPVVAKDIVFVTSGYGVGCNGFKISKNGSKWSSEEIYANKTIANHHGGVVLINGYVYGSTGGTFRCLELETGNEIFKERSAGKGSTLFAGGRFILRSEKGPVALIKATPKGMTEISKFEQPNRSEYKAWPHPVVANGNLYLRDQDILLCYKIRGN